MPYVHVETQLDPKADHWIPVVVALPARAARRLLAANLISVNFWSVDRAAHAAAGFDSPALFEPAYMAVGDDWAGDWIPVADLLQVPGAFIPR